MVGAAESGGIAGGFGDARAIENESSQSSKCQVSGQNVGENVAGQRSPSAFGRRRVRGPQRPKRLSTVAKVCETCGASYYPRADRVEISRNCGVACWRIWTATRNTAWVGERNPHWKGGTKLSEYARTDKQKHPERWAARRAARLAVARGEIIKTGVCCHCGRARRTFLHHHKGYAPEHWLDVEEVCRRCHDIADGRVPQSEHAATRSAA